MRLTAELIHTSLSYLKPLKERELDLRGAFWKRTQKTQNKKKNKPTKKNQKTQNTRHRDSGFCRRKCRSSLFAAGEVACAPLLLGSSSSSSHSSDTAAVANYEHHGTQ